MARRYSTGPNGTGLPDRTGHEVPSAQNLLTGGRRTGADNAEKGGKTAGPRLGACWLHLGIAEGWFVMGKSTASQSEERATVLETA